MKRIKTVETRNLKESTLLGGCGECQTSCQSACKTSCGVANQTCEQKSIKKSRAGFAHFRLAGVGFCQNTACRVRTRACGLRWPFL